MTKTLLLFDIDGTLLQVDDATRQAINKAFSEIFRLENPQQNVPFAGRTDLGIFKDIAQYLLKRPFQDGELKQVTDRYISLLPGELVKCPFRLMPGVTQLLPMLAAKEDIILGLETGNLEKSAYMKLRRGGLDQYFTFGGFGSDSEERSEFIRIAISRARKLNHGSILNENIFLIGDSPYDIKAGKKAGIKTIGVCTGHVERSVLQAESPTCVLTDLSDIPAFIKFIEGGEL
jgi:phosphoglycolate phosphatase-like HAD superfamily hydrolase